VKKLPIGIQTFSEIIKENYLYIDKTKEVLELIESLKYVFLSRPRRFGKSLFLDTLRNIFEGNKELFKGLYIYDKYDWSQKYPVIVISWGGADYQTLEDLDAKAQMVLKINQKRLNVECTETRANRTFDELIKETYKKYNQKVVILIDEYDKPILNTIQNIKQAKINREYIKGIYEVIKENDEYIRFAFLTGVSKFSKASIFSGLNMLTDISLNPKYGNICGYTQNDIETTFLPYLESVDLNRVKIWYNGYYFLKDRVYNPFDILQFINNNFKFSNYWFKTGTPTFLIKLIEQNNYFLPKLSNLIVGEELLDSFDIDKLKLEVILYQSGYLTIEEEIEKRNRIEYKLKLPNMEIKNSFSNAIIDYIYEQDSSKYQFQDSIYDALLEADISTFKETLISIFASIPYHNYTNNNIHLYEGFYASVIYVYLQSLGIEIIGEDVTNQGRIDLTLFIEDKVYIIEFKVDKKDALKQIKEKNYHQKYLNQNKTIYLIGINFDTDKKNIDTLEWEKLSC